MKCIQVFGPNARVRIISAAVTETLRSINQMGIAVLYVKVIDEITAEFTIENKDLAAIERYIRGRGDDVFVIEKFGICWAVNALKGRSVLLTGIIILIALTLYLPTRILFVSVEGNSQISDETILAKAEMFGIGFGADRRAIRSEEVKNQLLVELPQLQWVGINTYGCAAIISVYERNDTDLTEDPKRIVGIVARCDGVISEITAYSGNVLCRVGQSVKTGDLLVSPYTDCGTHIMMTPVKAEIYAKTLRDISAVMPLARQGRGELIRTERKYSIILGKNIIKLYNDSGISDTRCVKMYEVRNLELPGGFCLPIAIGIETRMFYTASNIELTYECASRTLADRVEDQLQTEMVSGQILSGNSLLRNKGSKLILQGDYYCSEMIGQLSREEILINYERSRENS